MRSLRLVVLLLCLTLVGAIAPAVSARAAVPIAGGYYPLTSARLLDTRSGLGAPKAPLGAGKTLLLTVAGKGKVPTSGVSAVVINLTVTGGTVGSFLSVYPSGKARPKSSTINYQAKASRANTTTIQLGTDGKIAIFNNSGSVSVIVDVVGYYASGSNTPAGTPNEFTTVAPDRLIDTRTDPDGILDADSILALFIDFGVDGAQNSSVAAVAVNVTAVGALGTGFLTSYDGGATLPNTSTLNFANGYAIANTAVVKTTLCQDCGTPKPVQFAVYNGSAKGVHVIVDLVGIYYHDGTVGLRFKPLSPVRIKDSRTSPATPLTAQKVQTVTAPAAVAGANTVALVTNMTAVSPTSTTYLTAWQASTNKPGVSNLNTPAHVTAANGAVIPLSTTNKFSVYNNAGTTNYLVDAVGQFNVGSGTAAAQQRASTGSRLGQTSVHSDRRSVAAAR